MTQRPFLSIGCNVKKTKKKERKFFERKRENPPSVFYEECCLFLSRIEKSRRSARFDISSREIIRLLLIILVCIYIYMYPTTDKDASSENTISLKPGGHGGTRRRAAG